MAEPQQQTFSDVQPIQASQTFTNVQPIPPSAASGGSSKGFWDNLQEKLPGTADTGLKGAVHHINDTLDFLKSTYDVSAPGIAQQIYKKLSGQPNELKQLPDKMITAFALGAEPEAEGAVVPQPEGAAPEAATGVIKPALRKVGSAATSVGESLDPDLVGLVSPRAAHALRLANKVGKVATKFGAEAAPEAAASESVPEFWGKGQYGTPVDQWGQRVPAEPSPVYPGGSEPATPRAELLKARNLATRPQRVIDPAAGLGDIPVQHVEPPVPPAAPAAEEPAATPTAAAPSAAAPPAATPKKLSSLTDLEKQISDSLGGKPLDKSKPIFTRSQPRPQTNLKQQIADSAEKPAAQTPKAPLTNLQKQIADVANPLPDGFTATPDSSLLKGYKYDPDKQQFSAVLNNGESYTHGEVSPEQVKAFEEDDSQGSAWTKKIKQGPGTVLMEKNGIPVKKAARTIVTDPETGAPEFSDVIAAKKTQPAAPPAAAEAAPAEDEGEGDLTSLLQKSVDKVVAQPGGVFTSAVPKDLLDRWGVDPESFTEGRSQTRGMSPDETAASIKKLTAAYKKGQPVEPVMETRDAANNITDVDGRGRALAAHRAGVERIPVIVRRMPAAQ